MSTGTGGVSGSGGTEPPLGPLGEKEGEGQTPQTDETTSKAFRNPLLEHFIELSGGDEKKGIETYNKFILNAFVMPMIQQMQKDEQKLKEIEEENQNQ